MWLIRLLLLCAHTLAQYSTWMAQLYGANFDPNHFMAVDLEDNIYLLATIINTPSDLMDGTGRQNVITLSKDGTSSISLIKMDYTGSLLWTMKFDGNAYEWANGIAIDPSSNDPIIAINSDSASMRMSTSKVNITVILPDALPHKIVRVKSSGEGIVWVVMANAFSMPLKTDIQSNIFVPGLYNNPSIVIIDAQDNTHSFNRPVTYEDSICLKLSSNGTFMWLTTLDGAGHDWGHQVSPDHQGGVLFMGTCLVLTGCSIWDSSNRIVMSITTRSNYAIKFNEVGVYMWHATFEGTNLWPSGISIDSQGRFLIIGGYTSNINVFGAGRSGPVTFPSQGPSDSAFMVRLSLQGTIEWTAYMTNDKGTRFFGVTCQDGDDSVYLSGHSQGSNIALMAGNIATTVMNNPNNLFVGFIIKLSKPGVIQWNVRFTSLAFATVYGTYPDARGNLVSFGRLTTSSAQAIDARFQTNKINISNSEAVFLIKYSTTGQFIASTTIESPSRLNTSARPVRTTQTQLETQDVPEDVPKAEISPAMDLLTVIIISSLGLTLLLGLAIGTTICRLLKSTYKKTLSEDVISSRTTLTTLSKPTSLSNPTSTVVPKSSGGVTSVGTVGSTGTNSTLAPTEHVLAIPAYLEVQGNYDFLCGEYITSGGTASLFFCASLSRELSIRADGSKMVAKKFKDAIEQMSERNRLAFFQELSLISRLQVHPNFPKLFGYSVRPVCMIMKYYEMGDLLSFILLSHSRASAHFTYTKIRVVTLLKDMLQALAFMHANNIAHCDVKPQNVLLDVVNDSLRGILNDSGISRVVSTEALHVQAFMLVDMNGASICYSAPEVLYRFKHKKNVNNDPRLIFASDTFSIAISILEMLKRGNVW